MDNKDKNKARASAYAKASARLRDLYDEEFYRFLKEEYAAHGLGEPRPPKSFREALKAEKEAAARAAKIAKHEAAIEALKAS